MNEIGKETAKYLKLINKKLELLKLYQELILKIKLQVIEDSDEDNWDEFEYIAIDEDILYEKKAVELLKQIMSLEEEIMSLKEEIEEVKENEI